MPDVFRTRQDAVNQAAKELHVWSVGQDLDADDYNTIDEHFDGLVAQLAGDEIFNLGDDDEIPVEIFGPFTKLLANASAGDFYQQYSDEAKRVFETQIRKMTAGKPTYEVLRTEYF